MMDKRKEKKRNRLVDESQKGCTCVDLHRLIMLKFYSLYLWDYKEKVSK